MRLFCWLQPPHIINIFKVKTTKSKITGPHKQTRVKPLRGVEEKKKKEETQHKFLCISKLVQVCILTIVMSRNEFPRMPLKCYRAG